MPCVLLVLSIRQGISQVPTARALTTGGSVIIDFAAPAALDLPRDPVVVVGSGAAGIPLSLELAERGLDVVMLESGGDVQDTASTADSDILNQGEVDGQRFTGLELGRGRLLGGTSQLWKGQCM